MSDTGDRQPPKDPTPDHDPDDLVGFASPRALEGRPRKPEPEPVVETEPTPEPAAETVEPEPEPVSEPVRQAAPVDAMAALNAAARPSTRSDFGTRDAPAPEAPLSLTAIYALILFAIPTVGVSAAVGLLAVLFRDPPTDEIWTTHHLYQLRTLWVAAIGAVAGVILIVVNLGVFVLFALALWTVLRGAWGVWLATRGRPVPNPRGWWVG